MIENTISEIEAKIDGSTSISDDRKRELLQLLGTLKSETGALARTHGEQAQNIADSVHASTQEATSGNQNADVLENSVAGLRSSVQGFEKSHPQLVQVVNRLSKTLSDLGI